ncbi:hypothetical protein EVAR_75742_1 [Eumeta japonica]|uniref:Uncharacterized protein n=1 Tax=Eumeta variegata TaxID=151549 RepID=A0A4C1TDV1_EUMVA|nr:hypothetical protein EVAR_75742_1 [Eumeta japonica]
MDATSPYIIKFERNSQEAESIRTCPPFFTNNAACLDIPHHLIECTYVAHSASGNINDFRGGVATSAVPYSNYRRLDSIDLLEGFVLLLQNTSPVRDTKIAV